MSHLHPAASAFGAPPASSAIAAILIALCIGCGPREEVPKYTEPLVVMRDGTKLLMAPADFAGIVDNTTLGTELKAVPAEADVSYDTSYAEVELADGQQGFIERKYLGKAPEWQQVLELRASAVGIQSQATGNLESRANLRLGPGRDTRILDSIAGKTAFQMYRRIAIMSGDDKEIWYLVDVGKDRVGYIFTRQLDFDVPSEFPPYTKYRRTVAWLTLGGDPDHPTYLAASIGDGDRDCDFDKVEIYAWDGPGVYYATVFVESGLTGVLPVVTEEVEGKWFFELRELKDEGIEAKRWSDTRPARVVETTMEESDGILH